jgi:hypothetical protein
MNAKPFIIIGAVGLAGYAVFRYFQVQASLLKSYEYKITSIKPNKVTLDYISLDLGIRFTSKSDIEGEVTTVYIDVYVEGKNVGFVTDVKPFIIPSRKKNKDGSYTDGSSDITLNVSFKPRDIFNNAVDILLGAGKKKDLSFGVKGYANVHSGFIRTTIPIVYNTTLKDYFPHTGI